MAESRSFLERVFGGTSLAPLVATFVEERELDETEIAELRRLLDRKSKRQS
jgi:predicted transcriptional regulator